MPASLRVRNRNQAKERLNRFVRVAGLVARTLPPRYQPAQRLPAGCRVVVNRLRRGAGLVVIVPPRREAIAYPDRLPPLAITAICRLPPPGRARIVWFFTRPGRESQGLPVAGKQQRLWMTATTRLQLAACHDNAMSLAMGSDRQLHLNVQNPMTIPLRMQHRPRLELWLQDP